MKSLAERFWAKVERSAQANACWNWRGHKTPYGHGYIWRDGRSVPAHRVAYELQTGAGPIPAGMVIDHVCRNPSCVRALHLELVTQAENTRRGMATAVHANSKKTHCPKGHPLTGDNLRGGQGGRRLCRACARTNEQRRRAALSKAEGRS